MSGDPFVGNARALAFELLEHERIDRFRTRVLAARPELGAAGGRGECPKQTARSCPSPALGCAVNSTRLLVRLRAPRRQSLRDFRHLAIGDAADGILLPAISRRVRHLLRGNALSPESFRPVYRHYGRSGLAAFHIALALQIRARLSCSVRP